MRSKFLCAALILALCAVPALALIAIMPLGPNQIATADAVFVGKVAEIEPADVEALPFPGAKETVKYKVAVVKITDGIHGVKDQKSVRVGFQAPVAPKPGAPIIGGGRRGPQLTTGQEGLFVISMHPDGKFYQAPNFGAFVAAANKTFDTDVKLAKRVVTVMANTKTALESKDADERLMAAAILVSKYRTQKPPLPNKEEPIDAAESKLILNAIATANWKPARLGETNPYQLFLQLRVTPADGWTAPKNVKTQDDLKSAVQTWIREKGDNYRIKRFVQAEK